MNKNGLDRNIPVAVKRQIRREAGFGCVICGNAIGTYEHIEPEYKDAREHDPSRMTFLCIGHHGKVTRKCLSKDAVWKAKEDPFCIREGRCNDSFDVGDGPVKIKLGTNEMTGVDDILVVNGRLILGVIPPDIDGQPFALSGCFHDENDEMVLEIFRNEWTAGSELWDIDCSGGRITLKNAEDKIVLQIKCDAGIGLEIEKLDMRYSGHHFVIEDGKFMLTHQYPRAVISDHIIEAFGRGAGAFLFDERGFTFGHAGDALGPAGWAMTSRGGKMIIET